MNETETSIATLSPSVRTTLCDEAATRACAAAFARALQPGLVVTLDGELGAGKTAFARATLRALGERGAVKSPTYALVEIYALAHFDVHHIDFYRLEHPLGWRGAGLEESFAPNTVVMIEWPSKAQGLPRADLALSLRIRDDETRLLEVRAQTPYGVDILRAWGVEPT